MISYASSDESVATVSKDGMVKAVLTAKYGNSTATKEITVK